MLLSSPALPAPTLVLQEWWHQLREGALLVDAWASLRRVAVGFTLASIAGISLGAVAAGTGRWGAALRDGLEGLRPIPPIAWIPLAILWLGLGDRSAWFLVFIGAFFPIFAQVCWALSASPSEQLDLARTLGASPWQTLRYIRLPAAAPRVASGLKTGLGLAWTSVIAAELVGAQSGLGYRIQLHRLMLQTEGVICGMLTIGLLGLGMGILARLAERRLIPWSHPPGPAGPLSREIASPHA